MSPVKNANLQMRSHFNGVFLPGPVLIGGGIMTALFSVEVSDVSLLKFPQKIYKQFRDSTF